jgi:alpha-tubulin suppressor-like RCC1 family protein
MVRVNWFSGSPASGSPARWRLAAVAGCIFALAAGLCTGPVASAEVPQTIPGTPTGWGANSLGAFGAPVSDGPAPVQITSEAGTTQVSMGCSHALYLHSDGTVWASGWNAWGQLGDGNTTNTTTATQVTGLTNVIAVAAGCYHSVALKSDGTVWIWGQNQGVPTSNAPDGTCPIGSGVPCFLHPTQWLGPSGITQIAAGTLDEVALASDGTVYTGGQIGNAHLTLPDAVTDVAMQDYAAEAITTTGRVYSWGNNQPVPALVPGITGFATALGGGSLSGYAVTKDGTVWAWGDDRYGQLGDGKTTSEASAIKVPGLPSIVAVTAGFYHAVALDASGGVWAWGDNVDGEVGPQQPQAVEAAPSKVPGIGKVLAITAGGYSTIALTQSTDQAISVQGGQTYTGTEPAAVSGTVATFTDPDPAAGAAEYAASIDWGDGTPATTGIISGPTGGPFTVTGSHTYGDEGSYPIKVTITDTDNTANFGTITDTATIGDASLNASGISPLPVSGRSFSGPVADFTDANTSTSSPADFTATIDWGDGTATSVGTVTGSGGSYQVSGSHSYTDTGYYTLKVHIADDGGSTADAQTKVLIYGVAQGGNFVIGDGNAATGNAVTFWGAQWHKLNTLTGGPAPASFKGFEDQPAQAACNQDWTANPGNSTPPPSGSLPAYMAVIVSSSVSQSGSTISGNTPTMVVVKTNEGYAPDPGHPGTGTVIAKIC